MANEHHAAVELVDGFRQRVDGLDVQVIGGLVEEQHVRVLPGQPGETHPALLTVRQVPDRAHLEQTSGVNSQAVAEKIKKGHFCHGLSIISFFFVALYNKTVTCLTVRKTNWPNLNPYGWIHRPNRVENVEPD